MNLDLLKAGYVFYLNKTGNKITGTYIKGNEFRVDGLLEEKTENLNFFEMLDGILKEIERAKTLAVFYDWETQKYVGEIRQEKYSGPYNEERFYEVTHSETHNDILDVLLTLDRNVEREKNEKENKTKILTNIMENLTTEEIQLLTEYALKLQENNSISSTNISQNKPPQRILQPKK